MGISEKIDLMLSFSPGIYQKIILKLSVIDSFKGSWKSIENTEARYLKQLRKIATIESIGSSTRIEGATLNDSEVEKLLKSVKITTLITRDEQEAMGYYDGLQVILDSYKDIPIEERYIHQLHGILLKHSDKDQNHKGKYKHLSNKVVANYPDGSQRVIFKTTDPHLTAGEMEQLLVWTRGKLMQSDIHPLLLVAVFIYEFLSIHPYQDGNGRLSRLLTTLLLMQMEYQFVQYVSFEHVIESKKEGYYRALMEGQKNRQKKEERIDQWILFFLDCLVVLANRLQAKYQTYSKIKLALNSRQQQILNFISERGSTQIKQLELHLPHHSRNTLKKDLSWLLKEDLLFKIGGGRGVHYHIKEG
jgi:Fic family protein